MNFSILIKNRRFLKNKSTILNGERFTPFKKPEFDSFTLNCKSQQTPSAPPFTDSKTDEPFYDCLSNCHTNPIYYSIGSIVDQSQPTELFHADKVDSPTVSQNQQQKNNSNIRSELAPFLDSSKPNKMPNTPAPQLSSTSRGSVDTDESPSQALSLSPVSIGKSFGKSSIRMSAKKMRSLSHMEFSGGMSENSGELRLGVKEKVLYSYV